MSMGEYCIGIMPIRLVADDKFEAIRQAYLDPFLRLHLVDKKQEHQIREFYSMTQATFQSKLAYCFLFTGNNMQWK